MEMSDREEKLALAKKLFTSVFTEKAKLLEYIIDKSSANRSENGSTERNSLPQAPILSGNENDVEISPIELFRRGEMRDEAQYLAIRDIINRKLADTNIRIIRDKDQHDSWVYVNYMDTPERTLKMYSTCSKFHLTTFADSAKAEIDDPYKRFATNEFKTLNVLKLESNEFVFILATALCIAFGHPVDAFKDGLRADGNPEFVRNKIADILEQDGSLTQAPEDAIWLRSQN